MPFFKDLNEMEIRAKARGFEVYDGYTEDESKVAFKFKCEKDGKKVYVIEYVQAEWMQRRADYKDTIERHWVVLEDGICISEHMRYWAARNFIGIEVEYKEYTPRKADEHALETYRNVRRNELCAEDNDNCAPMAITTASGIPYETVHKKALEYGFNPKGGGMRGYAIGQLMTALGIRWENVTKEIREQAKTTKSFEKKNIKGKYVMSVSGHCLAAINGTICDPSWDENLRLQAVRKIIS
jgi:hypothetical protein